MRPALFLVRGLAPATRDLRRRARKHVGKSLMIAKICFFVFLILFIISLVGYSTRGRA
jgi:hypothetical protein